MSVTKQLTLEYNLEMKSDFHVGSGAGIAGLVDRAVIRLANGELVVPGSTIKGRVRHHCEQLARAFMLKVCGDPTANAELCKPEDQQEAGRQLCIICRIFGSEWWPATLRFSDARLLGQLRSLVYQQRPDTATDPDFDYQVVNHTRTRMNRVLRRVEEGALYTFQEGIAGLTFQGRITGALLCVNVEADGFPLEAWLLVAGLRLLESLGGKKALGLGSCQVTLQQMIVERRTAEGQLDSALSAALKEIEYYDLHRNG